MYYIKGMVASKLFDFDAYSYQFLVSVLIVVYNVAVVKTSL